MSRYSKTLKALLLLVLVFSYFIPAAIASELLEGWAGSLFAGYNKVSGNTDKAAGNIAGEAVKKFNKAQFLLKGGLSYSESNKKMDSQKWDVLAKYAFDFGKEDKWYSFYQALTDHDYFADINYRITPSAGLGYHIAAGEEWVWDIDGGLGYRITRHRIDEASDDETLSAIGHTFMKKKIFESAFISEDFTVYPGLESGSGTVFKSESIFTNPVARNLDLEIKYIIEYNSEPGGNKKKTDTQLITGLKYKF